MLKKVVIILERKIPKGEMDAFRKMLKEEAIDSLWYIAENESSIGVDANTNEFKIEEILAELAEENGKRRKNYGTLFISNDLEICRLAIEGGCSCIAYLGMRMKDDNFDGIRYAVESLENIDGIYLDRICRRYAGLPWEILRTERCIVREMTTEDVDSFYEIYKDPSITAYMEGLYPAKEQEVEYIKKYIKNIYGFFEYGLWSIQEKKSGKIIGRAGISWREETGMVELGYVIAKSYQRQGYAFEVCSAILQYAKEELGIEQIAAYIKEENNASKALCQKLQFKKKGKKLVRNRWYEEWLKI